MFTFNPYMLRYFPAEHLLDAKQIQFKCFEDIVYNKKSQAKCIALRKLAHLIQNLKLI